MTAQDIILNNHCAALAKGLGRALLDTRTAGRLIDEDAVLDACLHNRSYDPQSEGSRQPWMIEILSAADAVDKFQEPILAALIDPPKSWDCYQLCDFAEYYASHGNMDARKTLYRIFDTKPDPQSPELAVKQIIRLDGLEGFLHITEKRGAEIRSGEDIWGLDWEVSDAGEVCSAEAVEAALNEAAGKSPNQRAYLDLLQKERRESANRANPLSRSDQMRSISVESIMAKIDDPALTPRNYLFDGWGRYASEEYLRIVLARLLQETDPHKLAKCIKVFSNTPLPEFDDCLIDLVDHEDDLVRFYAVRALSQISHPAIRALVLHRLESGQLEDRAIHLLKRNYQAGDHHLIESVLKPYDDPDEMHRFLGGLEDIFTANRTPDCAKTMLFAYESSPCSICRRDFVEILLGVNKTPSWLLAECAFDASPEIRELVAQA